MNYFSRDQRVAQAITSWSQPYAIEDSAVGRRLLGLPALPPLPGRVLGLDAKGLRVRVSRADWRAAGRTQRGRSVTVDGRIGEIVATDFRARGVNLMNRAPRDIPALGALLPNEMPPSDLADVWVGLPDATTVEIDGHRYGIKFTARHGVVIASAGRLTDGSHQATLCGSPVDLQVRSPFAADDAPQILTRDPTLDRWRDGISIIVTD